MGVGGRVTKEGENINTVIFSSSVLLIQSWVSPFLHTYLFSILLPLATLIFPVPDPFCRKNEVRGFGHRGGCRQTSNLFKPTAHIQKTDTWQDGATFSNNIIKSIKKKREREKKQNCSWSFTHRFRNPPQILKLSQHHSETEHKPAASTTIPALSFVCMDFALQYYISHRLPGP